MVPLKKLRKVTLPEEYKNVYKHYLEKEVDNIRLAYYELMHILDICHTDESSRCINQEIKAKTTLEDFTQKAYKYFLKILYVVTKDPFKQSVSIRQIFKTASEYAIAEYLSLSIVKSIS